jgi:hypothetical protein
MRTLIVHTVAVTLIIAGASTAVWVGPNPCNQSHCFKEKLPPGGGAIIDDPAQPQDRTGSANSAPQSSTGGIPQGGTTGVSPRPRNFCRDTLAVD